MPLRWFLPRSSASGGHECDPNGSMAFLQNQFRCPPILELEKPKGPRGNQRNQRKGLYQAPTQQSLFLELGPEE